MAALKIMNMAKLNYLTNEDKAKILHKAFYSEIPDFVNFVSRFSTHIIDNPAIYESTWSNGLFTFDNWLPIIKDVSERIKKAPEKIAANRKNFSSELFGDLRALFSNHCLILYINEKGENPDEKFCEMVRSMYKAE